MTTTPRLSLPLISASQAQKHVTHNEAILALDALLHLSVKSASVTAPPSGTTDGDLYLLPSGSTGAWQGHDQELATLRSGAWRFISPHPGWRCWIEDETRLIIFADEGWQDFQLSSDITLRAAGLAVDADPDPANPLIVRADTVLFDQKGGGHQLKINKASSDDTASVLLQTGYVGRAEIGLTGHDALSFKVSANGVIWSTPLQIDPSGWIGINASPPVAPFHVNADTTANTVQDVALFRGGSAASGSGQTVWIGVNPDRAAGIRSVNSAANAHDLIFLTNASAASPVEHMRIDASGRVGIGTSGPAATLDITSGGNSLEIEGNSLGFSRAGPNYIDALTPGALIAYRAMDSHRFEAGGVERARIDGNGLRAQSYHTGTVVIATDSVATITPPNNAGFLWLSNRPGAGYPVMTVCGVAAFDVGISPEMNRYFGGSGFDTLNGDVTGTTGTVGHVTIGVVNGAIKIENRVSAAIDFRYTFIG